MWMWKGPCKAIRGEVPSAEAASGGCQQSFWGCQSKLSDVHHTMAMACLRMQHQSSIIGSVGWLSSISLQIRGFMSSHIHEPDFVCHAPLGGGRLNRRHGPTFSHTLPGRS